MQFKNKQNVNCVKNFTSCIEWDNCDLPCIGIKKGDKLDELAFAIVDKLCKLSAPLDLSSISIQCLIDKLGAVEPLNKTLVNYLQLIIDNECKLADLIVAIQNKIDGITNPILILDLKCLKTLDSNGNQLPFNVQSVLQSLITEACNIRNQIVGLNSAITNLQLQINNLPPPYVEPNVNIPCVFTTPKKVSQALVLLASDYCSYKAVIGTIANIQTAIGRQCANLNVDFASNLNFVQAPTTLADSDNNQWILLCNMYGRLKALEKCACKLTCKDVIIGFSTEFTDDKKVILKFTSGAGTFIPVGFTDCGSVLIIKNATGPTTLPINIIITQEGETAEIDISMFNSGEYLTFNIDAKLCAEGISCSKCVSKVVRNTSGCCEITNNGTQDVTLIYKICLTS